VRALLCVRCNNGIALFDEDPSVLEAALDYLGIAARVVELIAASSDPHPPR
jgi:hypothetical protein